MELLTKILLIVALVVIIAFFVTLIVMTIIKKLASSKKIVNVALVSLLKSKCDAKPNKLMVFNLKDGSILTVKYQPKKETK